MNSTELVAAFAALGLPYWQTTLTSPRRIDSRVRDCIEKGLLALNCETPLPRGHSNFSSKSEIPPVEWRRPIITTPKYPRLGKLELNATDSSPFQVNVVDTPPKASEYHEQILSRPKRARTIVKRADIQNAKVQTGESEARVIIIPEALISSKVFAQSDDEFEDENEEVVAKKTREPPGVFANLKNCEKWPDLLDVAPLADQGFFRSQCNKCKNFQTRTVAPNAAIMALSRSSKFYGRWFSYFQLCQMIWFSGRWGVNYFNVGNNELKKKIEIERWLLTKVKARIRAKMTQFHGTEGTTTAHWALAYRSIEFRELSKTRNLVRFTCPTRAGIQREVIMQLPRSTCLELDIFHLCANPEDYFYRRSYQYFYNACTTNLITDMNTYLAVMEARAATTSEEIYKEFQIWWSFVAGCGGDYMSASALEKNRDYKPAAVNVGQAAKIHYR